MVEPIELETERLRLRQWLPADQEPFAALGNRRSRTVAEKQATENGMSKLRKRGLL